MIDKYMVRRSKREGEGVRERIRGRGGKERERNWLKGL